MKRFYVFKDGTMQASMSTKEEAIDLIRQRQKRETHPICVLNTALLRARKNLSHTRPRRNRQRVRTQWNDKEVHFIWKLR